MSSAPLISVLVPVYNVESYLRESLDSILAQSFPGEIEVILIDDGSTDRSGEICDEYKARFPNWTVVHKKNEGVSVARNDAVGLAKGEWITFVDSDDVIHPDYLAVLYDLAISSQSDIAMCDFVKACAIPDTFYEPPVINPRIREVDEAYLIELADARDRNFWNITTKLIRLSVARKFSFTPDRVYEDNALASNYLYAARRVIWTATPLYFYRINPNSITNSVRPVKQLDCLWAIKEQIVFYHRVHYRKLRNWMIRQLIRTAAFLVLLRLKSLFHCGASR